MSKGSYRKRFRKSHEFDFDLPEPIIQAVQSFLTAKEAARTTLLSKSWLSTWLTRPNLDLDQADFCRRRIGKYGHEHEFLDFSEKTFRRYENSKLKIDSFRLSLLSNYDIDTLRLIRRALKLGPTRLTFEADDCVDDLEIPDEVFRYEKLLSLDVTTCKINLDQELHWPRLRFLSLESAWIRSHDTIFHVLNSCPLIEKLSLCDVEYMPYQFQSVVADHSSRLPTIIRHRLKSLVLKGVDNHDVFLDDLSSKFPFLKDLTLHIIESGKELVISSPTLERLDFSMAGCRVRMVKLDVPSIRKLTFECTSVPDELFVTSNSRRWESCVSVTRKKGLSASWFDRLSGFIKKLSSSSRVFLSLHVHSRHTFHYEPGHLRGLPVSEIENLDIYHVCLPTLSCYALFDGLFRMCRPNVITQYMPNNDRSIGRPEANNIRFLGKKLLDALDAKVSTPVESQFMYGLNDLKKARIQVFDQDFGQWKSEEPIDALSNYKYHSPRTPTPGGFRHQKVRFRLYWKL